MHSKILAMFCGVQFEKHKMCLQGLKISSNLGPHSATIIVHGTNLDVGT